MASYSTLHKTCFALEARKNTVKKASIVFMHTSYLLVACLMPALYDSSADKLEKDVIHHQTWAVWYE